MTSWSISEGDSSLRLSSLGFLKKGLEMDVGSAVHLDMKERLDVQKRFRQL